MKINTVFLFLLITGVLLTAASVTTDSYAKPLEEVENSKVYKKAIGRQKKKRNYQEFYTEKWFDPGSFYGQVFLRDNGEQFLFEWLSPPSSVYSPAKTKVERRPEYFKTERTYLDGKSKPILVTVLVPHPRSLEAIHQGLVTDFSNYTPKEENIIKKSELKLKDNIGTLYQLQDGQCMALIPGAKESLIEVRVSSCLLQSNLEEFVNVINLTLFNQRMQS